MIDFRYHLVSLVSVFMALAIGILLGAGPLQNSIGEALSGEVDNLRKANNELKAENNELVAQTEQQSEAIDAAAPAILADTLTDRTVAIVRLPGVSDDDFEAVVERLTQAGATVTAKVSLTDVWTSAEKSSYRGALASQIHTYVTGLAADAPQTTILGTALSQSLRKGPAEANNKTLIELLSTSDDALISVDGEIAASESVVVLAPDADPVSDDPNATADANAEAAAESSATMYKDTVAALASQGATVVAGASDSDNDVVKRVRDAKMNASTADSLNTVVGQINVPAALASQLERTAVNLGFNKGASAVLGARIEAPAAPAPAEPTDTPTPSATPTEEP